MRNSYTYCYKKEYVDIKAKNPLSVLIYNLQKFNHILANIVIKKIGIKVTHDKNYRLNVAAVILSSNYPDNCEIFIAKRSDIKNVWQFPQGGIDENESPNEALFRELKEEIGTKKIEIIAEYPEWLSYDFPKQIATKMFPYNGQMQKYFLVKLKDNAKIKLDNKHAEFDDYKFIKLEEVLEYIIYFKKPVYKTVLDYFKKEGYL